MLATPSRLLPGVLPGLLLGLALLVGGCSDDSSDDSSDGSSRGPSDGSSETGRSGADEADGLVSLDGVSFARPDDYTPFEAAELFDGEVDSPQVDEVAERMGVPTEQVVELMRSLDVLLLSEAGARGGFVDNINVLDQAAAVPNDTQLRAQLLAVGAEVDDIDRVDTDLGEVAVAHYTLLLEGKPEIAGRGITVPSDGGAVVITVSTTDPATSDELADGILDSLAATS